MRLSQGCTTETLCYCRYRLAKQFLIPYVRHVLSSHYSAALLSLGSINISNCSLWIMIYREEFGGPSSMENLFQAVSLSLYYIAQLCHYYY
jgi:hypothetical protein